MIRVICDVCGTSRDYPAGADRAEVGAYVDSGNDCCRACVEIEDAARRFAKIKGDEACKAAFVEYITKARAEGKVRDPGTPEA